MATPTVIRVANRGPFTAVVITVSTPHGFEVVMHVYKVYRNTRTTLEWSSGPYSSEVPVKAIFDAWPARLNQDCAYDDCNYRSDGSIQ